MLMTVRTSAGIKASRIMLFLSLPCSSLSQQFLDRTQQDPPDATVLTGRGHAVAVRTELTWAFCECKPKFCGGSLHSSWEVQPALC